MNPFSLVLTMVLILVASMTGFAENPGPVTSWEDHLVLARATGTAMGGDHIFLQEESEVSVVTFNYGGESVVDVFYPPGADFNNDAPVFVVMGLPDIVNIRDTGKPYRYTGQALGWAQWAAENGFVVMLPETERDPKADLKTLIEWARTEGSAFGIDGNRVGYFSCSNGCHNVLKNLRPETRGIPAPSALFSIFYYGDLIAYSGQDIDVPYFVVAVKDDSFADIDRITAFVEKMRNQGAEVIFEVHESGSHGFDVMPDNDRTLEILDATMVFMTSQAGLR